MAPDHPEWKDTEPFKSVLSGDHAAMAKFTEKDWMEIVAVTHAGMSTTDFEAIVADGLPKSKNPVFGVPATESVRSAGCSRRWTTCAPTASAPTS